MHRVITCRISPYRLSYSPSASASSCCHVQKRPLCIPIVSTPPLLSATMSRTLFSGEFCGAADFLNLPPDRPDPLGRGDGNRRCTVLGNLLCDYQSPPSITHCSTPSRSGAQARAFAIVHSSMLEKMDG